MPRPREESKPSDAPTLRDLYPQLNDEQLEIAKENLDRFILLLWRIAKRLASDPVAMAEYKRLTEADEHAKTEVGVAERRDK